MPLPPPRNQQEIVDRFLAQEDKVVTEKLRIPGIETLHTKTVDEIAATLANVVRSRAHLLEIRWSIGEFIEVTFEKKWT